MEKMVLEQKLEAWAGGAERQTSATADKHGSVSEGEGVGGDEEWGEGVRGEAGNEAQGSFAKIQQWSERT